MGNAFYHGVCNHTYNTAVQRSAISLKHTSEILEHTITHSRSSLETHTRFLSKKGKASTRLQTEMAKKKNRTLWGGT